MTTARRLLAVVAVSVWLVFACVGLARAQDVGFSGVWVIDKTYSELLGTGILDAAVSITHQGPTLAFKRTVTVQGGQVTLEFTATTDGRAVSVKGRYRDQLAVSCLYQEGRLIIQRQQDGIRVSGGKTESILVHVTEIYSLSADRRTLTVTESSKHGDAVRTREMVFRRKG
jgi:hypothetical protein